MECQGAWVVPNISKKDQPEIQKQSITFWNSLALVLTVSLMWLLVYMFVVINESIDFIWQNSLI